MYSIRKQSTFIVLQIAVQFYQHHLLKRLSFSHYIFLSPLSKINWPYNCGIISGLSVLSNCVSIFVPIPYHFGYYSFVVSLKIWDCDISNFLLLLLQDFFGSGSMQILGLFVLVLWKMLMYFDRAFIKSIDCIR